MTKDEIYEEEFGFLAIRPSHTVKKAAFNAMDEYMKQCCLELLEYMAKNEVSCEVNIAKEKRFYFKGQWISKEELFENFL